MHNLILWNKLKNNYLDITKLNALGFVPEYTVYNALDRIMEALKNES